MIETRDLSCTFSEGSFSQNRFTAVSPISAIFKNGGRYSIVGESGSGKTTLARMIAGLQKPDGGNVYFDNTPLYGRHYKVRKEHFKSTDYPTKFRFGIGPKDVCGKIH